MRDVDIHATRVNGLSVRTVRGVRTLFKNNQPVETVSLGKSLENFLAYLEKTVRRVKGDNNIYTVLIGHNSQVFDNPTLLRQGGHQLCEKLSCLNVFFSDTLVTILCNTAWSPSALVRIDHELNCVDLLSQELQSLYKAVVLVI